MRCDDVQADLSALLDEALEPAERARVEAHIMGCPDCRRELDRLRQTVALLRGLEPLRAPAGFVERVLGAAGPAPGSWWPARLGRWLFQPLRVKLPLEAAVLLVAVTALYVWERTPEVRQEARQDGPTAPAPSPVTPAPAPPASRPAPAPPAKTGGARDAASRLAAKERAPAEAKREEEREEADGLGRATEAPAVSGPVPAAKPDSAVERSGPPAAPGPPSAHRFATRALVAVDVGGRLRVADRAAGRAALDAALARLDVAVAGRRPDPGAPTDELIELLVPRGAYGELVEALGRIGEWRPDPGGSSDLPDPVRVVIRLSG
jgi:hypothetical protein